ncbi:hypothetical protein [Nocardioides sp. 503]|uniref:hypothetical protein n=1 Tax=Nocardioides sp. 503 TaxID=2508326 RepID=UPI00106FF511|nr:hypothetical protein [Nocardioides sp. 503]
MTTQRTRTAAMTTAALALVGAATATDLVSARADAGAAAPGTRITVAASDGSVHPGEQLVLTGRLAQGSTGLRGSVRVYGRNAAGWYPLTGAQVRTASTGGYRVRVVLSSTGDRTLKVVGDPDARELRNASARVRVSVR